MHDTAGTRAGAAGDKPVRIYHSHDVSHRAVPAKCMNFRRDSSGTPASRQFAVVTDCVQLTRDAVKGRALMHVLRRCSHSRQRTRTKRSVVHISTMSSDHSERTLVLTCIDNFSGYLTHKVLGAGSSDSIVKAEFCCCRPRNLNTKVIEGCACDTRPDDVTSAGCTDPAG